MKLIDDSTVGNSWSQPHADSTNPPSSSGRGLELADDSPLADLLSIYTHSDRAQIAALAATSGIFAREVVHYLGLASPDLDEAYDFASLAETVQRHSTRKPGRKKPPTSTCDSKPASDRESPGDAWTGSVDYSTSTAGDEAPGSSSTAPHVGRSGRKKDRSAGRRFRREQKRSRENPDPLPDFPGFALNSTFNGWTHQFAMPDDISEYSTLLGATTAGTYKHITSAMTLVHGLPQFHQRCIDGDFTIEHVIFVTRRCRDVEFKYLPTIDDYLADRRADITIDTFKRSLALKIAATQPAVETLEKVSVRRRVDISTGDDGTSYLTLTGPAPELHACYRRIEAFARAVHKGNTAAFGDQLNPGDDFEDTRGIDALMFDILTRTRPQLKLRVTSHNTSTGGTSTTDFPIDEFFVRPDGVPTSDADSLLDFIDRTFGKMPEERNSKAQNFEEQSAKNAGTCTTEPSNQAQPSEDQPPEDQSPPAQPHEDQPPPAQPSEDQPDKEQSDTKFAWPHNARLTNALLNSSTRPSGAFGNDFKSEPADRDGNSPSSVTYEMLLEMPTGEYWLAEQARTTITVPMLTMLNQYLGQPGAGGISNPACDVEGVAPDRQPSEDAHSSEDATTQGTGASQAKTQSRQPRSAGEGSSANVCDLAGMLPDGSPLPADMARRLAGYSSTWTRILTDPATGTPLDAKATSYTIPRSVRQTLTAQWLTCTVPGCTRRAETSEVDHIEPFNHDEPDRGGLTRFGNLHSLCKLHHQAKTDNRFSVTMTDPGRLEYVFRHGITAEVLAPDNPINVEHARLFLKYFAEAATMPAAASQKTSSSESPSPDAQRADSPTVPTAPPDSPPQPGNESFSGQRKRARSCPEPAAEDGRPGWCEYVDPFADSTEPDYTDPDAPSSDAPSSDAPGSDAPGSENIQPGNVSAGNFAPDDSGSDSPDSNASATGAAGSKDSSSNTSSSNTRTSIRKEWFWDTGEPPPF